MHTIKVNVILSFISEESQDDNFDNAEIEKTAVPLSLIIESLRNLTAGLSAHLVKEAYGDVEEHLIDDYLQGMINLDRLKLEELLKTKHL
jgi:hypothetical protein